MELARIMATHRPAATIQFAAIAGEEQGLFGSGFMAQTLADASANVQGMWTNDIVGSPIGDDGRNSSNIVRLFAQGIPTNESTSRAAQRRSIGGESDSPARQLGRFTRDVASNAVTGMRWKPYTEQIATSAAATTRPFSRQATQQTASPSPEKTSHINTKMYVWRMAHNLATYLNSAISITLVG